MAQTLPPSQHANPSTFFTNFLYKSSLIAIFLVLLPFFPSVAPDFLHTRSWELLQLICVGIAVSYGLFSKKNDHPHKDHTSNAQSYVSKLLQVSSVFDDESESHEVHTWNSQYLRGEPEVLVANEGKPIATQKPLLLPVRSLKQQDTNSSSRRIFRNSGMLKNGGMDTQKSVGQNAVVLPSPIPWRSRSGRMENGNFVIESKSLKSAAESSEDTVPPPPPPPPPRFLYKPMLSKSNSTLTRNAATPEKLLRRSVRSVPTEEFSDNEIGEDPTHSATEFGKSVRTFKPNETVVVEADNNETIAEKRELVKKHPVTESEGDDECSTEGDDRVSELGADVNKKADEFIAKFREQIRLQRIESIRRSAAERGGRIPR